MIDWNKTFDHISINNPSPLSAQFIGLPLEKNIPGVPISDYRSPETPAGQSGQGTCVPTL